MGYLALLVRSRLLGSFAFQKGEPLTSNLPPRLKLAPANDSAGIASIANIRTQISSPADKRDHSRTARSQKDALGRRVSAALKRSNCPGLLESALEQAANLVELVIVGSFESHYKRGLGV